MSATTRPTIAFGLFMAISLGSAAAQPISIGTWTGQVIAPGAETVDVTYEVRWESDSLRISIIASEHGTFETSKVHFEDGELLFSWAPGVEVDCTLRSRDGVQYRGQCVEPEDLQAEPGYLIMVPPVAKD